MEASGNVSPDLVTAWSFRRDCAFPVRGRVSRLAVGLQEEAELSSHVVAFRITDPIHWHPKLHFSDILTDD